MKNLVQKLMVPVTVAFLAATPAYAGKAVIGNDGRAITSENIQAMRILGISQDELRKVQSKYTDVIGKMYIENAAEKSFLRVGGNYEEALKIVANQVDKNQDGYVSKKELVDHAKADTNHDGYVSNVEKPAYAK